MNCSHCQKSIPSGVRYRNSQGARFCSVACEDASDTQAFVQSLPRAYRRTIPERLPCQIASRAVLKWQPNAREDSKTSLYLRGQSGAGKTRTALLVAHNLIAAGHITSEEIKLLRAGSFADEVIDRTRPDGRGGFDEWFDELRDCSLLIFDEVDKLTWTPKVSSVFFELVESRTSNERATIFIAQQPLGEWIEGAMNSPRKGGPTRETFEAIHRRLKEFFEPYTFAT